MRLPGRYAHDVFERSHREALLNGEQHARFYRVDVRREMADEVVFRQPAESLFVNDEVGQRGGWWPSAEKRAQRLALSQPKGGDVYERDDVRCVGSECRHDLAAIGVAGDYRRAVLTAEDLPQACDVGRQRSLRKLRRGDLEALGLERLDDPAPARSVGPGAVNENNVWFFAHSLLLESGCWSISDGGPDRESRASVD